MLVKTVNKPRAKLAWLAGALLLAALLLAGPSAFALEYSFHGYVKFDLIMDLDSDLSQGQLGGDLYVQAPPLDGSPEADRDGGTKMHARQSRLIFATKGELNNWPVRTHIEGDFFNGGQELRASNSDFGIDAGTANTLSNPVLSNSRELRLRQAFFTYGPFLFGQAWTLFMGNLSWAMETADFKNQSGIPFIRQPQIRLTLPWKGGQFAVALENPTTFIVHKSAAAPASTASVPVISTSGDTVPDFTAHLNFAGKWGNIGIVAVTRTLRAVGAGGVYDETAQATAFGGAGRIMVGAKSNIRFGAWSGQLGRYGLDNVVGRIIGGTPDPAVVAARSGGAVSSLSETATILGDAYISSSGSLETVDSTMTVVSLQLWISDSSRVNLGYGLHSVDLPDTATLNTFGAVGLGTAIMEEITDLRVSYFWHVASGVQYGVEWISKEVTAHDGVLLNAAGTVKTSNTGDASRLQFTGRFKF